jgi:hypothetical protein
MNTDSLGRKLNKKKKHWSWAKKVEVATAYLALGKAPLVEAVTKVPAGTLHQWKQHEWWNELIESIRAEEDLELDSKLGRIVSKSVDIIQDRLENGDYQYDPKEGKLIRRPVSLRDTSKVASETIDRRNILRQIHSKPKVSEQSVQEQLKRIAEQLTKGVQNAKQNQEAGKDNGGGSPQSEICKESRNPSVGSAGVQSSGQGNQNP